MDKNNGRVQVLNGRVFYSPNCRRTVDHPPPIRDERGGEPNPFLPGSQTGGRRNFFELDITKYTSPRWWTLAFGWISFFPLTSSLCGPIFEKLFMPRSPHYIFDEELDKYFMPPSLIEKWLRVDRDISDAVYLIRRRYPVPFVYPVNPFSFGYSKGHTRTGGLHMALRKGRDWFVVWIALLSYVVACAEDIYSSVKDSSFRANPSWYEVLLEHFDARWLDALYASTVCSFSPHTPRAGVFLELEVFDSNQPLPDFFCRFHVPVWYPWSSDLGRRYEHLAPLPHQLQEGTTFLSKSPPLSTPTHISSLPPFACSSLGSMSSLPPVAESSSRSTWSVFISKRLQRYEERVKRETPQEKQIRLSRLLNPPKVSAKVFEWVEDDDGVLRRQAVSKKMRDDILDFYKDKIHYDPIENEYDCCEEYNSGATGEPVGDDDDDLFWCGNDVETNQGDINRSPCPRVPSPDVEIDDSWTMRSVEGSDPRSPDNFIAEVHRILFLHFGYTPLIPVPTFHSPVLKTESDRQRFVRFFGILWQDYLSSACQTPQISAASTFVTKLCTKHSSISSDQWDLHKNNRQSIFLSARLKALRCVGQGLFMFDFKDRSTVKWKLTLKTASHALLVCRLDLQLDESDLAYYLLQNGIPFHTLQLSSTLSRAPNSRHPPFVIPFRSANYVFTWRDYDAFREQCLAVLNQPRGRAALLRGYFPWRLAINDISFSSVIAGPSGWTTEPKEMLVVDLPETGEEYIDDSLTDIELQCLTGTYSTLTGRYLINKKKKLLLLSNDL